ncbi:hypothetical protein HPB50_026154 [Hyalomma asiaticum]|uniref:Uncharacterized protein n=1 Tax=Hyalomma asiaticum TaxID=266040 RepID=A0ACB7SZS6_HYAAI|nr:hypothetical protein HPB50_026154 [Hyalomma asiaticum]
MATGIIKHAGFKKAKSAGFFRASNEEKGGKLCRSRHVFDVVEETTVRQSILKGRCVRQANVNQEAYAVIIEETAPVALRLRATQLSSAGDCATPSGSAALPKAPKVDAAKAAPSPPPPPGSGANQRSPSPKVNLLLVMTGIGKATAMELARRKARVILACRNTEKARSAAQEILDSTGRSVVVKQLDLASFKSVNDFCDDILRTETRLDVLINNAGIVTESKAVQLTEDGYELCYQSNYLSHYLLTMRLLGRLLCYCDHNCDGVFAGLRGPRHECFLSNTM